MVNELIIDDNNVAFNPMYGNSYKLNDTAKEIIKLLNEGRNRDEILDILTQNYDVDKNDLFIDLSDFLNKLKIYGLVQ